MEQLCRSINMPEEVTRQMVQIHDTLDFFPCLDLLMQEEHWTEGLEQLECALGDDPCGFRGLCCMLRCALRSRDTYAQLNIPEQIYVDTMGAFSRFVREHRESYGSYGFDRGFWVTRQISAKLFRIGQLEYELTTRDGAPIVSLHIPTDADLRPEVLRPSLKEGLAELLRLFPEYNGTQVYCHSWLLSPMLREFLPENSNILHFQELFQIESDTVPGRSVLLWVFKNPNLPPEQYPEHTSLQRKLKSFFLSGGQFFEGRGWLRLPLEF